MGRAGFGGETPEVRCRDAGLHFGAVLECTHRPI